MIGLTAAPGTHFFGRGVRPALPTPSPSLRDMVTLSGPVGDKVESVAVSGAVAAAPSMLGAAFGWGGVAVGLGGAAALTWMHARSSEQRRFLVPYAVVIGAVAGVLGMVGGWPGALIATAIAAACDPMRSAVGR